jgi:hypothetical protein
MPGVVRKVLFAPLSMQHGSATSKISMETLPNQTFANGSMT